MLAQAALIGFIPVTDFARAEAFYAGVLGLRVTDRDNPFALVLAQADGTLIRCTIVPADTKPYPFTILGWQVPDIAAALTELAAAHITPIRYDFLTQSPTGIWTAPNGDQVAWFKDPFGNILSLSQHSGAKA